jgi:small nuclear ribonucleoprotein (snRNP)-like protein
MVRGNLHSIDEHINHLITKVRAQVEHPFRVLLISLFAFGNLNLVRKRLMA